MISLYLRRLTTDDVTLMEAMTTMFGEAFSDMATYTGHRPSAGYLRRRELRMSRPSPSTRS